MKHYPAVYTLQTVGGGWLFNKFKRKEAGNFWIATRETLQWLCKVI